MEMICSRCVMDSTDPDIIFDKDGVCNHCKKYDELNVSAGNFDDLVKTIKQSKKGNDYDCLIGVSGGVDSSFVAYKAVKAGLSPLAIHLDNGWNTDIGNQNVKNIIKSLDIPFETITLKWDEFKDLQLAFLKASVPDLEIPTDHALLAVLHRVADQHGIKYILMGCNTRTESHVPTAWSQGYFDWKYINSIHQQFGLVTLRTYPHLDLLSLQINAMKHRMVNVLNYLDYNKQNAMKILENEIGWKYYGGKHYESVYTRFYQGYILPTKFGFDKRKSHFSSLICAGEMTRERALNELELPTYPFALQEEDRQVFMSKLSLTENEFNRLMALPNKKFTDYPSNNNVIISTPYKYIIGGLQKCGLM